MDFTAEVRIPEERVAVLIGKKGSVKKALERNFRAKIFITEGLVTISGEDSLMVWLCEKSVKAIARGFNPELVKLLQKDEWDFDLISLNDYVRTKNDVFRLKGRVIGREGIAQKMIEKLTGAYIVVYGKTVAIIAMMNVIESVRKAIEMILKGARHVSVYKYLEKENLKRKREAMFHG